MEVTNFSNPPKNHNYDAIIMCVSHEEYKQIDIETWLGNCDLIIDANNVFTQSQSAIVEDLGLPIHFIGRS